MGDVIESVEHPARKISKLRRWVGNAPAAAARLRVSVVDSQGTAVIAEYDAEDVGTQTADEILEQLESLAEVADGPVTAQLCWLSADDRVLRMRAEKVRRPRGDALAQAGAVSNLSGSRDDQAMQAQRHLEVMARTYANATLGLEQQTLKVVDAAVRLAQSAADRSVEMEREMRRMRNQIARLLEERGVPDAEPSDEEHEKSPMQQLVDLANAARPLIEVAQVAKANGSAS